MTDDRDSSSDAVDELNELAPVSTELLPVQEQSEDGGVDER